MRAVDARHPDARAGRDPAHQVPVSHHQQRPGQLTRGHVLGALLGDRKSRVNSGERVGRGGRVFGYGAGQAHQCVALCVMRACTSVSLQACKAHVRVRLRW